MDLGFLHTSKEIRSKSDSSYPPMRQSWREAFRAGCRTKEEGSAAEGIRMKSLSKSEEEEEEDCCCCCCCCSSRMISPRGKGRVE